MDSPTWSEEPPGKKKLAGVRFHASALACRDDRGRFVVHVNFLGQPRSLFNGSGPLVFAFLLSPVQIAILASKRKISLGLDFLNVASFRGEENVESRGQAMKTPRN